MNPTVQHATAFTEFAQASIQVKDEAGFIALVNQHVKPLLPHGMLLAVIGRLHFDHLQVHHHIAMGYAQEALSLLTQPIHIRDRPLLQQWLHARLPVVACPVADRDAMSAYEQFENQALGLGRLALHGLPDLTNRMGSYFSFAQVHSDWAREAISQRLCIMVPLLHTALLQVFRLPASSAVLPPLTAIERELLVWLAAGRSNQEMATIRQRSLATIRNQLVGLYAKLGVSTRAEAVAMAMGQVQPVGAPPPQP
jgi:DNA-binding CsgD family transcriptional regulator